MAAKPISSAPKFPLFAMKSPQHSGILTPPLHTLASVPFKWEEKPGKPKPCTDLITLPNSIFNEPKCLEPPPRFYLENTKIPSPTTVLDGPYNIKSKCRNVDGRGQLGTLVLYKSNKVRRRRGNWWQRYLKRKETSVDSTDCGSGSDECGRHFSTVKMDRLRRNGTFSSLTQSRPHIWASIYEGFKQVIPWKNKKSKKEVLIV
ncbi:uncharacterized protein At4g00950 [Nicotiana tabacum]|uniref:Uncharacterized protein At4g00950 n=1 Tax=Nicotiana tabacum TaxID=4097 RepID=A0A1S4APY8_TOBAC|nr:PREDICTED: uncharacterized protein At4g00950-like [Nicotiana tabacum]